MANQAAKKAIKAHDALKKQLTQVITAINVWYIIGHVLFNYRTFQVSDYIYSYIFLLTSTYFSTNMVLAAVKEGVTNEYAMDYLILTLSVQFLSVISSWAWYIYATIPSYGAYKIIQLVLQYVFKPDPMSSSSKSKRQEKRERKAEKYTR